MKKKKKIVESVAVVMAVTTLTSSFHHIPANAETQLNPKILIPGTLEKGKNAFQKTPKPKRFSSSPKDDVLSKDIHKQLQAVAQYVEKAEKSLSGEDVYYAHLLVEKLPKEYQHSLKQRLNQIIPQSKVNRLADVKLAEREVALAEKNKKDEEQLKKAQKSVYSLYMSKERTSLVERLNVIYEKIIKEKEAER